MRTALKAVIVLFVLLIVGFIAATFYVNGATRSAVEHKTGDTLGSPTHLDSARVGLLTGNFRLGILNVKNPEGFDSPVLLRASSTDGDIRYATLFADVVELPRLTISGIEATLERRNGRANYDAVLQSIRSTEQAPEEGRRYIIRELVLNDIVVNIDMGAALGAAPAPAPTPAPGTGNLTKLTVRIPEMRLTDIGTEMDRGVVLEEVAGTLFKALIAAVLERGGEEIPGIIASELATRLGELDAIPGNIMEIAGERLGETLRDFDPSRLLRRPGRE